MTKKTNILIILLINVVMRTLTLLFIGVFPILLCAQTRSHIEALQEAYSYCKTPLVDSSKFDTVFDYSESIMEFQRNGSVYLYAVHIPEKNVCVFVSNEKQYTTNYFILFVQRYNKNLEYASILNKKINIF